MLLRSKSFQIAIGVLAFIALLGVLRFKPWQRGASGGGADVATSGGSGARQQLGVGFLPVT